MHIMHVIDSLQQGGAERMLVDIANQTAAEGERVSVTVTRSGADLASELRPEITVSILGRQKRFDVSAMRRFARLMQELRPEILHAHSRTTFAFLALLKSLGLVRASLLLHDHYGKIEIDRSVPLWFKVWGRRYVDQYVGVCRTLGAWAEEAGVPTRKISVIGNAIDLRRILDAEVRDLRKEFDLPGQAAVGIVVAGIRPEKGIETLLESVARAESSRPFRVIVVGGDRDPAYGAACRDRRDALGLQETVMFVGERADVPSLIRSADFALMPSLSESGPLVLVEFMAGGVPFVSTGVGDIAQRVSELRLPEFVPPGDSTAFASAMSRLLALSSSASQERGKLGQAAAVEHFSVQAALAKWRAVYEQMMTIPQA